jgi:hypothetical protein
MHSSHMLREGARPEVVRDILGHANIDVTQNVYGKSWWDERVDAVAQAVEAVSRFLDGLGVTFGFRVFRWPLVTIMAPTIIAFVLAGQQPIHSRLSDLRSRLKFRKTV